MPDDGGLRGQNGSLILPFGNWFSPKTVTVTEEDILGCGLGIAGVVLNPSRGGAGGVIVVPRLLIATNV